MECASGPKGPLRIMCLSSKLARAETAAEESDPPQRWRQSLGGAVTLLEDVIDLLHITDRNAHVMLVALTTTDRIGREIGREPWSPRGYLPFNWLPDNSLIAVPLCCCRQSYKSRWSQ